MMRTFSTRLRLLLPVVLLAFATSCDDSSPTPNDLNLVLGNPSGAISDPGQPNNYLLTRPEYALSYHRSRGIPNWVSWHLTAKDLGTAPRQDNFRADNALPAGWYQVTASSYTGSGFDRGHHCPSADRTASTASNSATFLMTNMLPQAPNLNQRTWADLEEYCRTLARNGNDLYIVMGSYGTGGTGSQGADNTIDQGRVTVPARVWKVVVVLPAGQSASEDVTTSTRIIAVNAPNQNSIGAAWGNYRTTVDALETATGLDLLSAVAPAVQATLEARVDSGPTQ